MKKVCPNGDVVYINSDGKLHRTDGPAVKYANGYNGWYIDGEELADMKNGKVTIRTKGELPSLIKQSIAMEKLKV